MLGAVQVGAGSAHGVPGGGPHQGQRRQPVGVHAAVPVAQSVGLAAVGRGGRHAGHAAVAHEAAVDAHAVAVVVPVVAVLAVRPVEQGAGAADQLRLQGG